MFDHYIAVDWSQKTMAIARMTRHSNRVIERCELPTDLLELKGYLRRLKGKKILTFEETTTSQWLYTELREYVDKIVVCDPWRNHLLKDGPKTDKLDAEKLVKLLRAGLLKPVFHSGDEFLSLRKLVSGYRDVIQAGVRWQNQRIALLYGAGKSKKDPQVDQPVEKFVLSGIDRALALYEQEKHRYEKDFHRRVKTQQPLRNLISLPGIGEIGAVKILARVVEPSRFRSNGAFWSYCGLVKLEKMSGGRSYGKKGSQYCRTLKEVFKTGAMSATQENRDNPLRDYYLSLIHEKNYPDWKARHAVARRLATLALGVLRSGKKYQPHNRKEVWPKKQPIVVSMSTDL